MTVQPYQLVMRTGPTPGKTYPLSKSEIYIGRDVSNDIAINDSEISRKHARLTLQEDSFVLEDLGSTNGTFVEAQRLMGPHVLSPGELIMFGENVGMVFEAVAYDPNATVVAAGQVAHAQTPPPPAAQRYAAPSAPPVYAQQVPASPMDAYAPPPKKKGGCTKWVLAGCGCIVVVLCLVVVGLGVWYAASPSGFEDQITKIICSGTLKSVTEEILKLFGDYACPVP
jgi:hypothetical protein